MKFYAIMLSACSLYIAVETTVTTALLSKEQTQPVQPNEHVRQKREPATKPMLDKHFGPTTKSFQNLGSRTHRSLLYGLNPSDWGYDSNYNVDYDLGQSRPVYDNGYYGPAYTNGYMPAYPNSYYAPSNGYSYYGPGTGNVPYGPSNGYNYYGPGNTNSQASSQSTPASETSTHAYDDSTYSYGEGSGNGCKMYNGGWYC